MNFTIRTKLLGGFILILLLMVLVSVYMARELSSINQRLTKIVEESAEKVKLSNQIQIALLDAGRHEKNMILEKDPVRKQFFRDKMYDALEVIDRKSLDLKELADEKGKELLKDFTNSWDDFRIELENIVSFALKGNDEDAFRISAGEGLKARDNAINQLNRIVLKNETSMREDKTLSDEAYSSAKRSILIMISVSIIIALFLSYWIIKGITNRISKIAEEAEKISRRESSDVQFKDLVVDELRPVFNSLVSINNSFREVTENANSVASGNYESDFVPRSDKDTLGNALKKMTISLRESTAANEKHNWLSTGKNQLNEKLMGDLTMEELAYNTITFLSEYLKANIGAVYLFDEKQKALLLSGQYAFSAPELIKKRFGMSEGLIGQSAAEQKQISMTDFGDEDLRITSSLLNAKAKNILITPFAFEGKVLGVIEIGRLSLFTDTEKEFINDSLESIAISINSAIARKKIQELLEETQVQSEELQSQQEELKQMNEELEEQAQNLKQQQEELQMTNEELEEQTQSLEMKNKEVQEAKYDIEQKTKQLEISSKYKSEFLANMSHELRTPLNSLLILSKDLSDNKKKNLSQDQVESAEIIYKSGNDLLVLINEVLDLSKIEAGKMDVRVEKINLRTLSTEILRSFNHQAEQKGLNLKSSLSDDLPEYILSDSQRLNQILKNLLSNAVKFTEKGKVELSIRPSGNNRLVISVSDTGIGIEEDKQMAVFEAFQQADGGTSRKYGGTGLGLSISRELARLLGGEIQLSSKVNEGSVFSLVLPIELSVAEEMEKITSRSQSVSANKPAEKNHVVKNAPALADDREILTQEDKVVLIIEDDLSFADILYKQAKSKGFKCLSAGSGEDGLMLAQKYHPQAIILDLELPGMHGEVVLTELKSDPTLRHIPVHIISARERSVDQIKNGAIEYLMKPVNKKDVDEAFNRIGDFLSRKMKNLLIIEDDENSRKAMRKLIGNGDVHCFEAGSGKDALEIYQSNHVDCIVLDIGLPDISGFDLIYELEKIKGHPVPPIIIYTGRELSKEESNELQKYAETIIIKGVKSEERLLDETALFLHRTISNLPESKRLIIANMYDKETILRSKKILLVDDDMRNVFALSKILKERGMDVIKAENGKEALAMLDKHKGIDMVLMDIMMPEMDGYEAMKRIREQEKFRNLPVIALTAKAMKDDKQKCIDAGANDYITKPVDVERLLSLMRIWINKGIN